MGPKECLSTGALGILPALPRRGEEEEEVKVKVKEELGLELELDLHKSHHHHYCLSALDRSQ